ncbi:MAG: type II toxin-antitoxin system PemK/MazF family toxin [Verrucomicrobia bacterium]|nr:type II toxin-antitoxin system PemK/MazF family toxin [Verrucomicrobiota bacterium]
MSNPRRGEIWLVELDPTRGSEMKKTRMVLVVSSDAVGVLPIKLGVPITEWRPGFSHHLWHVRLDPDARNGLTKSSALDALQVRALAVERFVKRKGVVTDDLLCEVTAAIAALIEHA